MNQVEFVSNLRGKFANEAHLRLKISPLRTSFTWYLSQNLSWEWIGDVVPVEKGHTDAVGNNKREPCDRMPLLPWLVNI